jgi:hypothetical protein
MSCESLRAGLNQACEVPFRRYYQQAVLVNRADVDNKNILTSYVTIEGEYVCRHRVVFDLLPDKTGYRFMLGETAKSIYGMFDKTDIDNIPQYQHTVNIVLTGISEAVKCLFKQLDYGDYFAALQTYDGTVEIFGFEYGLTTAGYGYDPMNSGGGGIIKLTSMSDALEDEPPFLYGGDPADFDTDFADVVYNPAGDFNDDFNDDFNNQE